MLDHTVSSNIVNLSETYNSVTVSEGRLMGRKVVISSEEGDNIPFQRLSTKEALKFLEEFHFSAKLADQTALSGRIGSAAGGLIPDGNISDETLIDVYTNLAEDMLESDPSSIGEIFNNINRDTVFNKVFDNIFKLLSEKIATDRTEVELMFMDFAMETGVLAPYETITEKDCEKTSYQILAGSFSNNIRMKLVLLLETKIPAGNLKKTLEVAKDIKSESVWRYCSKVINKGGSLSFLQDVFKFNFESENDRREALRLIFSTRDENSGSILYYLDGVNIEDPKTCLLLAKLAAEVQPDSMLSIISKFNIDSESERNEILMYAIAGGMKITEPMYYLNKLKIESPEEINRFSEFILRQNIVRLRSFSKNSFNSLDYLKKQVEFRLFTGFLEDNGGEALKAAFENDSKGLFGIDLSNLKRFYKDFVNNRVSSEFLVELSEKGLFKAIIQIHNPEIRSNTIECIMGIYEKGDIRSFFGGLNEFVIPEKKGNKRKKALYKVELLIFTTFLNLKHKMAGSAEATIVVSKAISDKLISYMALDLNKIKLVLNLLYAFIKAEGLEVSTEVSIFEKLQGMSKQDKTKAFKRLLPLAEYKQIARLLEIAEGRPVETVYEEFLEEKLEFIFKGTEDRDIVIKFAKELRNTEGLVYYISLFEGQEEYEGMQNIIKEFILEVVHGTFVDERYKVSLNPHLESIFRSNPGLKEKWTLNTSVEKEIIKPNRKGVESNGNPQPAKFNYHFNTDAPQDLFLCGTDVDGSCQDVFGSPELNKCLMGYVMNGQCRLLAIKNDKGRIVARSIIKLLSVEGQPKPVLFMEKVYFMAEESDDNKQDLIALAEKRAEEMGLDLYNGADIVESEDVGILLVSGESRAPFEYSDAASDSFDREGYSFRVRNKS